MSQRVDRILSHLIPSQQSALFSSPTSSTSKPVSGSSTPTEPLVLTQVTSTRCGHLILNRPAQLHSLTQPMIRILLSSLRSWMNDSSIRLIVIQSSTDKAFCAGGDIRTLHTPPYPTFPHDFFREEYILDYIIATYPKPYVSILKGIVMGGGAGLSINGKYRIATDNTLFAMPETGIGLFTDVGGTHFLTHRCPGEIGMYLGLTGERIQVADTLYSGLASHYVPLSSLSAFTQLLTSTGHNETGEDTIQRALQQFAKTYDTSSSPLCLHRSAIDDIFGQSTLDGIFKRLQNYVDKGDIWAKGVQTTLSKKSPISLQIVFLALRRCRDLSLAECLRLELRLATRICITHAHTTGDFIEGVRAVVIDKDNKPIWKSWRNIYDIEREYFPPFYPSEGYRELDVEKEAYLKTQ